MATISYTRISAKYRLLIIIYILIPLSTALPISEFYPYGSAHDKTLEQGDDLSIEVLLTVPVKFFGETYETIYVNTNGLLSFIYDVPYFSNVEFPLEYPVIAPLYSNVDTTGKGKVYYRETNDSALLQRATQNVLNLYPNLPNGYEARSLFIATWDHVGYFEAGTDKVNTFQTVISTDGYESFVELLYADGGIQWMQAINHHGIPEARAQAGIVAQGGKFYTLRGSGTDQVINLDKWTNADRPGMFIFRIGNINDTGNVEAPPNAYGQYNEVNGEPKTCFVGATNCHSNAECIEEPEGYCCRCQPSYFGNGRTCLEREVARRIFGKLKLFVQEEPLEDLDFHGYIVTKDGKIYIAVNNLPESLGYKIQLLFTLDSFVGWLFGSPKGDAKNGYMLTGGVVNHTADITFDDYYRVSIKQRYSGLNLFDHIKMEGEVYGTLPDIPKDVVVQMPDFKELYTRTGPGEFRSSQKYEIQLGNGQTHRMNVDQTFNFIEYCKAAEKDMISMRMDSVKNYINYDRDQSILRFASFNKIFKGTENTDDPCIEGRRHCVANSSCLVEGDGFRCVCNSGFRQLNNNLYPNSQTDFGCADINECIDGTNACHPDALCVNEIGSYNCQCKPGYVGDGKHCQYFQENQIPPNAICQVPGDYSTCSCKFGYEMVGDTNEAGFSCNDIDECTTSYVCPEEADCINVPGNFTCRCREGYEGDPNNYCYPTNPCRSTICPENTVCENRDGRAQCICAPGTYGTPPNCIGQDVNQCQDDSECGQNGQCYLSNNRYQCGCLYGYKKNPQGQCELEEEITKEDDCTNFQCPAGSRCSTEHGYGPRCICTSGSGAPPHCDQPTDQCNGQSCSEHAQCIYIPDEEGYKCMCQAGYEGDGYNCRIMEISCEGYDDYCHYNASCLPDEENSKHICICKDGFEGDGMTCYPIGQDLNQCQDDRECGPNGQCYLSNNRYQCGCLYGYKKNPQGQCELEEDPRNVCSNCDENALCVQHYGQYDCICNEGFEGDGFECTRKVLGCDTIGGCSQFADCIYSSSVSTYVCYCREGYKGNGTYCEQITTCYEEPELCSPDASCTYLNDKYVCECNDGFFGNGTICREAKKLDEEYLLLNKGRTILKVPFNPTRTNRGRPIHIYENQTAIGIAIDCVEGRVYWSDITNLQVKSSKYDGTDFQIFMDSGIKSAEGLAIDWVNREVYWTDSGYDKIVAVNLDTKDIRTVASENLINPRGIAVNPYKGKVYWSDWNREDPKIEWANLDGSERQIIVKGPYVKLPNSLAIDWSTEELCWADAGTKTIECLNVEANRPRTIIKNCSYPYGLAITDDTYYWTDWNTLKLESSPKNNPSVVKSIDLPLGGYDKLYGVVAVTSCP
ncbi:hypothetical protein O3M35_007676 [Rhynocoris fuscipes]|uniref:Uncharacterized protein n=1 Tax=Rhynocoris fuscipes TaxID=488301 RepID=A0AAW1DAX4_9HEMI